MLHSVKQHRSAEVIPLHPTPEADQAPVTPVVSGRVTDVTAEMLSRRKQAKRDRTISKLDVFGDLFRAEGVIVRDKAHNIKTGKMVDFRKRRITVGLATVALTVVSGLGLGNQLSGLHSRTPVKAPTSTQPPAAPVICEFSPETFVFIPKDGQGWGVAVAQTEGAMEDATCYEQELNMLENRFGSAQKDLYLTSHPSGYPIPKSVHRVVQTPGTSTTTHPS
jgi:hypothetical protein